LLAVALVVLGKNAVELCRDKAYAIDEFLYVHRAWSFLQPEGGLLSSIGRGDLFVPAMVMAPFTAAGGDDPATMIYVRLSMLIGLLVALGAVAVLAACSDAIDRRGRHGVALLAAVLVLGDPTVMKHLIEVRPDCVALALLLAALAILRWQRLGDRAAAVIAGLLVFAACMSSVKTFFVGAGLGPIVALDLWASARGRPQVTRSAIWFIAGFGACVVVLLAVILTTSTPGAFWRGFYEAKQFHEQHYTPIPLGRFFWPYVKLAWPVIGMAIVAATAIGAETWRRWRAQGGLHPDLLLVLVWLGAWASYLVQKAGYPYSLIPVGVVSALLAARGIGLVAGAIEERRRVLWAAGALVLVGFTALSLGRVKPRHSNEGQIAVQRRIGGLTRSDDAAYDLSASYVYRPRGHRFAFVDRSRRLALHDEIVKEVPRSLIEREVVLFVWDVRFASRWRNTPLGEFIFRNYQPRSSELFFWGRRYELQAGEPLSDRFRAVKSGRYFVHPARAAERIRIDGQPIDGPIVELEAGVHPIDIRGAEKTGDVYVVWLPADGQPFNPARRRGYGRGRDNDLARWILP
jgi:hypothetical protein